MPDYPMYLATQTGGKDMVYLKGKIKDCFWSVAIFTMMVSSNSHRRVERVHWASDDEEETMAVR